MKQVCLFASELAIITRHNRYENISKIIHKIWEKNFNDDLQNLEKMLLDQNINHTLLKKMLIFKKLYLVSH